jgi:hypothetical protein
MGLFDWLNPSQSNVETLSDIVWLTKKAKYAGIVKAIESSLNDPDSPVAILLMGHFQECLTELQQVVEAQRLDDRRLFIALVGSPKGTPATMTTADEPGRIDIILGERHPLPSHDKAVVEWAEALPCRCQLVHHLSLEDPLMRMFAGEWVEGLLKKLGMSEDEAIESHMVARRIEAAQKKIEGQSISDLRAESAERWLELNCPAFWRKHLQS